MNGKSTEKATVPAQPLRGAGKPGAGVRAKVGAKNPQKAAQDRPKGLDWGGLTARYEERLLQEKEQGLDPVELKFRVEQTEAKIQGKPAPKKTGTRYSPGSRAGIGGAKPSYDRKEIVRLYVEDKRTVPQIAEKLGCNKQTVYSNLKAANVEMRDDRKVLEGRKPQTHCKQGHEFTEANTRVATRNDGTRHRSCKTCDAARAVKRREAKKQQQS